MAIAATLEAERPVFADPEPSSNYQPGTDNLSRYQEDYWDLSYKQRLRCQTVREPAFRNRLFPFVEMAGYDAEFMPFLSHNEAKIMTQALRTILTPLGRQFDGLVVKKYWATLVRVQSENGAQAYEMLTYHPDRLEEGNDPDAYPGLGLKHNNCRQTQQSRKRDGAIYPPELEDPALYGKENRGLVLETTDSTNTKFAVWGNEAAGKLDHTAGNTTLAELIASQRRVPLDPCLAHDFSQRYDLTILSSTESHCFLGDQFVQGQISQAVLRRAEEKGVKLCVSDFLRRRCLINAGIFPE